MFALDQIAHVGVSPSRNLKLISRHIVFEVFQHVRKTYVNVTVSLTDRQTGRRTTYCGITALCVASRGKNLSQNRLRLVGLNQCSFYLAHQKCCLIALTTFWVFCFQVLCWNDLVFSHQSILLEICHMVDYLLLFSTRQSFFLQFLKDVGN